MSATTTTTTGSNSGPGYKKSPDHRVELASERKHVRVIALDGETIADTKNAIALQEATYPVVYYVPRADIKMDRLTRTDHKTHCPFKGDASYFSIKDGPENAVWTYEHPYDEVLAIKDHVAFYPSKVKSIEVL